MFTETDLWLRSSSSEDLLHARSVVGAITQDNLVDVQVHAVRGIETMKEYIEDARQAGDHELVGYFERVSLAYLQVANEAGQLLLGRLPTPNQN